MLSSCSLVDTQVDHRMSQHNSRCLPWLPCIRTIFGFSVLLVFNLHAVSDNVDVYRFICITACWHCQPALSELRCDRLHITSRRSKWQLYSCSTCCGAQEPRSCPDSKLAKFSASCCAAGWWFRPEFIINELNINSVITSPSHDETMTLSNLEYTVRGYAYTGMHHMLSCLTIILQSIGPRVTYLHPLGSLQDFMTSSSSSYTPGCIPCSCMIVPYSASMLSTLKLTDHA